MKNFRLTLIREQWQGLPKGHHAIYVEKGSLTIAGTVTLAGESLYIDNSLQNTQDGCKASIVRFSLEKSDAAIPSSDVLMSTPLALPLPTALMRLDQVTFPPAAIAYRHTHPGPGIRYLLKGTLELEADDHTKSVGQGDAWFEDADSPVRATASDSIETAFIRCMILPVQFEGLPTINILDANDKSRPMLQSNHRFLDQRMQLA